MKIEVESEFVIMKMTVMEAQAIHLAVCRVINDIKANRNGDHGPEGEGNEMRIFNTLSSLDNRLYDAFYKHQHN